MYLPEFDDPGFEICHPEGYNPFLLTYEDMDWCQLCERLTSGVVTSYQTNAVFILTTRDCIKCREVFIK